MVETLNITPTAILATTSALIGHLVLGTFAYNQVHALVQNHHRVRRVHCVDP